MQPRKVVVALGIVFLALGILGFVPGVTREGLLLGVFEVNAWHNIVHLLSGLAALLFAATDALAKSYARFFGWVYAVVAVLGLIMPGGDTLGMRINGADNVLHIALTAILLTTGYATRRIHAFSH